MKKGDKEGNNDWQTLHIYGEPESKPLDTEEVERLLDQLAQIIAAIYLKHYHGVAED